MERGGIAGIDPGMSANTLLLTGLMTAAFATIHLTIGRLRFLSHAPRSQWLSFAGGAAVAYVFLHILPELASHRSLFARALSLPQEDAETVVYGVAMIGLALFYGLERLVTEARSRPARGGHAGETDTDVEWVHIGSFAIYNILIGYLLTHREDTGPGALLLFYLAMSFHFVTTDHGLREDHVGSYDRYGRWVLVASVVTGWVLGLLVTVPPMAVALLFAFLAGGVILNVLKEELPEERQSRFASFALGAAFYSAMVIGEQMLG